MSARHVPAVVRAWAVLYNTLLVAGLLVVMLGAFELGSLAFDPGLDREERYEGFSISAMVMGVGFVLFAVGLVISNVLLGRE